MAMLGHAVEPPNKKDTLGQAILSTVERVSSSQSVLIAREMIILGHYKLSLFRSVITVTVHNLQCTFIFLIKVLVTCLFKVSA